MGSNSGSPISADREQILPHFDSIARNRRYAAYVACVIVATIAVKFTLARSIPYSQALTDDYDYMYKSLCFLQGDWTLSSYSFKKIYTGPAYPLLISPWVLFSQPRAKMLCIYTLQFLMSAGVVWLGTALVARFSNRRSLLVPLVLATYAPTFLFNYYAMTENVFFLLLIVAMWLCVDFEKTCRSKLRLVGLFLLCSLFPLIRSPGFAILPVLWAMLFFNRKCLGWKRSATIAVVAAVVTIAPEQYFYHVLYGATRMGGYATGLANRFQDASEISIWRPVKFFTLSFLSQVGYTFVTTGVWMVPSVIVAVFLTRRLPPGETRTAWRNLLVYAITMALVLLAFTEVHISSRAQMNPEKANFVIGRYGDPAAIVLGFAGLCALMSLRKPGWKIQGLLIVVVPIALYAALRAFDNRIYHPMHDIGLSALALKKLRQYPAYCFWTPIALAVSVGLLSRYWKLTTRLMLALVIGFNFLTLRNGYRYTSKWSLRIAGTLASAEWTVDHLPESTRILCDQNIRFMSPPPGLPGWKWRNLYNVYMAYVLMVYPRYVDYVRIPADTTTPADEVFGDFDYLLSVFESPPAVNWGFPVVWNDDNYVLYRLAPDERREFIPIAVEDFELSKPRMREDGRILMAWHNCSAHLRTPMRMTAGAYELVIIASAQGCAEPPPMLIVDVTGRKRTSIPLVPEVTQPYTVPLVLPEDTDVEIRFIANEKPRCEDKQDKNIVIHNVRFEHAHAEAKSRGVHSP